MNYQTIIINQIETNFNRLISKLNNNGILWVIFNDKSDSTNVFETMKEMNSSGLILKNIILWINKFESLNENLINCYKTILFFTKSEDYFFNKDPIREKHIWKDVEWGKRAKNYNINGKDPSNVWIKTIDNGKAKIIGFKPFELNEIIERLILCSSKEGDKILIVTNEKIDLNLNRNIKYEK